MQRTVEHKPVRFRGRKWNKVNETRKDYKEKDWILMLKKQKKGTKEGMNRYQRRKGKRKNYANGGGDKE